LRRAAIYRGIPTAIDRFRAAREVLKDRGI